MSVDKSKTFTLIPEKVTHGPIVLLLQLCNSRPHGYANFQFYSFISYYCSSPVFLLLTLVKSICLFLHLMYVNSNLNDAQKTSQGKSELPLRGGWKPNSPTKTLKYIKQISLSLERYASSECGSI